MHAGMATKTRYNLLEDYQFHRLCCKRHDATRSDPAPLCKSISRQHCHQQLASMDDAEVSWQNTSAQDLPCQMACRHHLNELGWLPLQCCAPGCESTCFRAAYGRTSGKACGKLHDGCCCGAALLSAGGKGNGRGGCSYVTFSHGCCPVCWSDSDSMSDCLQTDCQC